MKITYQFENVSTPVVYNLRPEGHIRAAASLYVVREDQFEIQILIFESHFFRTLSNSICCPLLKKVVHDRSTLMIASSLSNDNNKLVTHLNWIYHFVDYFAY
ncbi:hypothetical protein RF11_13791 [Thelohanellus kitauei]|uniref:Uncharacterized protein n=1 Tax=Thelohanellus kitauei TaxID=669202 RepID=A0A0C2JIW3_THEKT|nr:hypothetical protein RF11_13791 [Thelohanellus kitauei]